MSRITLIVAVCLLVLSCKSTKKTEEALNTGNYALAIDRATAELRTDKNAKKNEDFVRLLELAYRKAVAEDKILLNRLLSDPNPAALRSVYETYEFMEQRQAKIRPLLPLTYFSTGKQAQFEMLDYSKKIIDSRDRLSAHLLEQSRRQLYTASSYQSRQIYRDLEYLSKINPNYKDVNQLLNRALEKGTDYVLVSLRNDTQQVIPDRLENELLNFSTYGLNDQWTIYHEKQQSGLAYDYDMNVIFTSIQVTPDQVLQRELQKERSVKDGFIYELDRNGNVKKDSLGNDIKKDKFVTVRATVFQSIQSKDATIDAQVHLKDRRSGQLIDRFPINSTFSFEYIYSRVQGDERALEQDYLETLNPSAVPFPTTEQMIYDAGEDIKLQFKQIISRLNFNKV